MAAVLLASIRHISISRPNWLPVYSLYSIYIVIRHDESFGSNSIWKSIEMRYNVMMAWPGAVILTGTRHTGKREAIRFHAFLFFLLSPVTWFGPPTNMTWVSNVTWRQARHGWVIPGSRNGKPPHNYYSKLPDTKRAASCPWQWWILVLSFYHSMWCSVRVREWRCSFLSYKLVEMLSVCLDVNQKIVTTAHRDL